MTRKQFDKMPTNGTQSLWTYHCGDVVEVEYASSNFSDFRITFKYEEKIYTQSARNLYLSWDDALCMIDDDSWKRTWRFTKIIFRREMKNLFNKFKRNTE